MLAEKPRLPHYDAIIVGSGVAGALVAKELGRAGKKVLILEAGPPAPVNINSYMRQFYADWSKVPESPYPPDLSKDPSLFNVGRPNSLSLTADKWRNPTKSYLIQTGKSPFASTYERVGGGTAMHWLGTSLRLLPNDFRMNARFGRFVDWPIDYGKLEEWYCLAEREIGVSADSGDQSYHGLTFSQEYPMPGIPKSLTDMAVADAVDGLTVDGITLTRASVRSTPAGRNSQPYQNRRVCGGNTNCIPICPIQAKYDPTVTLNDALGTGNVEICYQTVACRLEADPDKPISKIFFLQYEDLTGGHSKEDFRTAEKYIIAAHAIETPRLLLMSKTDKMPDGVANGSKLVGKNLMDHPFYVPWALLPEGKQVFPYRGPLSTSGIEDFRDGDFRKTRAAYRIEIGNEGWNFAIGGDPAITTVDFVNGLNISGVNDGGIDGHSEALFGQPLRDRLNSVITRQIRLGFLVEQEPKETNCVGISREHVDHLNLPRPEIRYELSDYEKGGLLAAKKTADAIFARLGAKQLTKEPDLDDPSALELSDNGKSLRLLYMGAGHIMGTYRMGDDPKKSVVDSFQKSHDHDNLYLIGSGVFPTAATGNPTLTLAALCLRTAEKIIQSLPKA
jgi:choline dehydrogenase-like flavoprotein